MAFRGVTADDDDFTQIFGDADWANLRASLAANDWIVTMNAGDRLRPHALAVVAEKLAETSELDAIYTDEDCVTPEGTLHSPALKPDWSPIYQTQTQYVERALFIRADVISQDVWLAGLSSTDFLSDALNAINAENIHHLRRILYCCERPPAAKRTPAAKNAMRQPATAAVQWPAVSVIIPTKDKVSLLATCLEGIELKTDYPNFNIVIVDNGSTAPETLKFLENLRTNERIRIVRSPGPFNFSKLCNVGAAASESPVLLFLNNDTEIRSGPEWLKALVRWAVLPQTGAVGAKLFFANGRIQHAGVVLGLGGIAGHAYLHQVDIGNSDGRWFDVTHEISAITGACLAVEREKFDAEGGFDEKLAVDLNDIDLCLRLATRGLTNVWTPDAKLIHRESSSRGIAKNYFEAYSREIAYFNDRWTHVIRDDPYFHPGLSLYAHDIMLA
jgi:GT2 family glycosyltransferase